MEVQSAHTREMEARAVLEKYQVLKMACSRCGQPHEAPVPVDLGRLTCECGQALDPVQQEEFGPVNHLVMRRLTVTCYRHTEFAREVIELYKRDCDHAKAEEWGIDKSLLAIHAANALALRARSASRIWLPLACLLLAVSVPLGSLQRPF